MEQALQWISQYGYFGIFALLVLGIVGLPVPDETLLTFAGYLIYRGQLHPIPAYGAALAGSMCGITVSYTLGRLTGYLLVEKYGAKLHIKMERVERIHAWFRRAGGFTLTFGYFVPGVRHLTAYVAGASELEAPAFAFFAYSGAALWTASFITLGYFLGEQWNRVTAVSDKLVLGAVGVAVLAGAIYALIRVRGRGSRARTKAPPSRKGK
jgi:membrane protein DedA with SNARE-associated domain